jgi:RND family efflux transporter MFP subunit
MRRGNDKITPMVPSRATPAKLLAALLLAAWAAGCQGRAATPPVSREPQAPREPQAQGRPQAAAAVPAPASPAPAPPQPRDDEGWIGVLVARQSVDVTADIQGRLAAIRVRIGDAVRRGDPIAALNTRVPAQELEMARASLRGAEADLGRAAAEAAEAQKRSERRKANPDFFSKEDVAEAELRTKTSQSALEAAQARVGEQTARVRQLEASLGQSEIRAPFAGRVAERFVDVGAVVGPGTPIVRLVSGDGLIVRAAVPPEAARSLVVGQAVTVRVRELGLAVPGRIERIAPEVDAASQMVLVEARLEPPAGAAPRLQMGLVVDVTAASHPV